MNRNYKLKGVKTMKKDLRKKDSKFTAEEIWDAFTYLNASEQVDAFNDFMKKIGSDVSIMESDRENINREFTPYEVFTALEDGSLDFETYEFGDDENIGTWFSIIAGVTYFLHDEFVSDFIRDNTDQDEFCKFVEENYFDFIEYYLDKEEEEE